MISSLRGTITKVALDHAVVEVGGVGFHVNSTPPTLAHFREGSEGSVFTTLVVRDDALTVYGFSSEDERDSFLILTGVTGVGPKLAISILSVLSPEELRLAVAADDLARLQQIPGIGKKSAQRLVLELAGKIGAPHGDPGTPAVPAGNEDIVAALTQLGWTPRDANNAVEAVKAEHSGTAAILRAALQYLAAGRG